MLTVSNILAATGGSLRTACRPVSLSGVSIDSRTLKKGELFVAVKGKNFDGHAFIGAAIKKGARVVLCARMPRVLTKGVPVIKVKETVVALGQLAHFHRCRFTIPIIAITGSTGKTTTKDMIAQVLSARYTVLKNVATQNNAIGVALTLLQLRPRHQIAVVELGTNHFGEIRHLTNMVQPTVAVLTNIGESHLQFFKTPQGVLREKSDLVRFLHPRGVVVYNRDDRHLRTLTARMRTKRTLSFGIDGACRYRADRIRPAKRYALAFCVHNKQFALHTPVVHNIYNALAAIACGRLFAVPYRDICAQLRRFSFPAGRQSIDTAKGYAIIDDTYNANPVSVRSALQTLQAIPAKGRKIFVCADMLELGAQSQALHRRLGLLVVRSSIDMLITHGKHARLVARGARKNNTAIDIVHCATLSAVCKQLKGYLRPGDAVLVKGSRAMHMDKVVSFIKVMRTKGML